jgi:purine-binding chemotaxis protein CheW
MSLVYVLTRTGTEHYAFPVEDVLEVAGLEDVTPMPGAPSGILGVRNLRGQVLPVVDLGLMLGVGGGRDTARRLVVVEQAGRQTGLAVDELEDVSSLPETRERPDSPFLTGAAVLDGVLVGIVDVRAVLDSAVPLERRT